MKKNHDKMMACTTAEPSSKRARVGPQEDMPMIPHESSATADKTAAQSAPQGSQKIAPKKQLEELPYRRADGKWTCTFSTGGMNKNR